MGRPRGARDESTAPTVLRGGEGRGPPHSLVSMPWARSGARAQRAHTLVWLLALTFQTVI